MWWITCFWGMHYTWYKILFITFFRLCYKKNLNSISYCNGINVLPLVWITWANSNMIINTIEPLVIEKKTVTAQTQQAVITLQKFSTLRSSLLLMLLNLPFNRPKAFSTTTLEVLCLILKRLSSRVKFPWSVYGFISPSLTA